MAKNQETLDELVTKLEKEWEAEQRATEYVKDPFNDEDPATIALHAAMNRGHKIVDKIIRTPATELRHLRAKIRAIYFIRGVTDSYIFLPEPSREDRAIQSLIDDIQRFTS